MSSSHSASVGTCFSVQCPSGIQQLPKAQFSPKRASCQVTGTGEEGKEEGVQANASERDNVCGMVSGVSSPSANAHCGPTTHQKPCLVLVFVQNTWAHKVVDLNPTRTPKQTKQWELA